ncbi:Methyltransferase FkbM domain protein [Caballeronia sp. SBC2]|nr:Methyltransferase FkbM domain protein [Caballeronia sp. SBC2]
MRSRIKQLMRRAVAVAYRPMRVIVRPILYRVRTFLFASQAAELDALRRDLFHEIRHTHAIAMTVVTQTAQSVQRELINHSGHLYHAAQRDQDRLAAGLHQAIQHSRESLREDVFGTAESSARDVRTGLDALNEGRLERMEQYTYASARRVAVHCEQGTVLVKTSVGYLLCSDTDHALLAGLIDTGELEPGTRIVIERFLRPDDVFVDVGANVGMSTLAAARTMQGKGKIFAFEPFAPTRELLEKTVWLNGFSDIFECIGAAAAEKSGETLLFLGGTSGHHSLFPASGKQRTPAPAVNVPVVTLDQALPSGQAVTLVKIDAEGAELSVIAGARSVLAGNADVALIVEFGLFHLKRSGHSPEQWLSAFTDLGFDYFAIHPTTGELSRSTPAALSAMDSTNLFLARPHSSAWSRLGATP